MNTIDSGVDLPPLSLEDKRAISLPSWYSRFRGLTIRTRFIPISDTFLAYLRSDGVFLPASILDAPVHGEFEGEEFDWTDSNEHVDNHISPERSQDFDLSEVQNEIANALTELSPSGNGVFLKTNWSAPKDASFLIGSLQVQAIADVFSILKSSSCTALDLDACAACGCTPMLCLRSFVSIPPQHEFRVFFVSGCLVAACQRHVHQFYPHLHREVSVWSHRIEQFCTVLLSKLPVPSCVIDIAFTEQSPKGIVVDLDAFCCDTSTLLFSPAEIMSSSSAALTAQQSGIPYQFELRVVQSDNGLQPSLAMYHGIPLDLQNADVSDLDAALQRVQRESNHI